MWLLQTAPEDVVVGLKAQWQKQQVEEFATWVRSAVELSTVRSKTAAKVRHAAVLCCAVLCCAALYCAVRCGAVRCCAVLCCTVLCGAVWCSAVLCCAVTVLYNKVSCGSSPQPTLTAVDQQTLQHAGCEAATA